MSLPEADKVSQKKKFRDDNSDLLSSMRESCYLMEIQRLEKDDDNDDDDDDENIMRVNSMMKRKVKQNQCKEIVFQVSYVNL